MDSKELSKKLDELLKELEQKIEEKTSQKDSKEIKKIIDKQLEKENDVVIFGTQDGSLIWGTSLEVCGAIALMLHKIKNDINIDMLIEAVIDGLSDDTGKGKYDRDILNMFLENLKEKM